MSSSAQDSQGTHQLQAILPDWCALNWQHALICLGFVVMFLHLSYLPVPTGKVWNEVANGQAVANRGITVADPALPYAQGIRALKTNWLGETLVYWTYRFGGPEWLSCMFALIQLATLAVWGFVFQKVSGRTMAALLAVPILIASSVDVNALGSANLGMLVFALITLTLASTIEPDKYESDSRSSTNRLNWQHASIWQWLVVVGLFVLWANLDVSVLIGVGILAAIALSRFVGVLARRNGHGSIMSDRELHHRTWLFEICLCATLLQPNGLELWQSVFWSTNNPILHAFGGWSPVAIASWRGVWIAAAWLGWIVASRSTNRLPLWNIGSAILVTGLVACFQSQIVWFATTMCFLMVALLPKPQRPQSSKCEPAPRQAQQAQSNSSLRFAFTLVCGLLLWVGFSLSPIGTMALAGKPRTTNQLYSSNTPLGASAFLKENRPAKVVWTPKHWADHLQVEGAPTPVMANLNDVLLTPRIEKDYQSIYFGGRNWQRLLRRYQIDDLVVDKQNQTDLMQEIRLNAGPFEKVFEDQISVVYRRSTKPKQPQSNVGSKTVSAQTQQTPKPQKPLSLDFNSEDTDQTAEPTSDQASEQAATFDNPAKAQFNKAQFNKAAFKNQKPQQPLLNTQGINQSGSATKPSTSRKPPAARLFDDESTSSTSIFGD